MNYKIGLDIGIASVGFATILLNEQDEAIKILDMGSRIFDAAEVAKTGASLAKPRRLARGARRRLRRHAHRIYRIKYLLETNKIITVDEIDSLYERANFDKDVYQIRCEALQRSLDRDEFVRLLVHLAQRRGFKSNRKTDGEADKETGKLTTAVSENRTLLLEKGYETIGEMLYKDDKFAENKRNKSESYSNTFSRAMLIEEIEIIFGKQSAFGNNLATPELAKAYIDIYSSQRNFDEGPGGDSKYGGNQIEKMLGYCTFEKAERRGLKAQYTVEYTSLLEKINSIKIADKFQNVPLSKEQKDIVKDLFLNGKDITYAKLRKALNLSEDAIFNISYGDKSAKEVEAKTKLNYMKAYQEIKKAYGNAFKYLTAQKLDDLGYLLSVFKNDDKIESALVDKGFTKEEISIALTLPTFNKTANLSLLACKKIIPFLEEGATYDKACEAAGYVFKADDFDSKTKLLPANAKEAPELDEIKNPVVRRAISQTIKVVNGIIRQYGESPTFLSVELARELSNNFDERRKIEKEQNENYKKNQEVIDNIKKDFHKITAGGMDLIKLKLWKDQDGICPYSQRAIAYDRLFEDGYVDIDHIIPYSICFNDSYKNKVLTFSAVNRQKGNRLPMQYLQGQSRDSFVVWVQNNVREKTKRFNLLKADYTIDDENEWKSRNLNDTKYISRFVFNYIDRYLSFAPNHTGRKKTVTAVNGAATAYMRKRWGINKIRADGDTHHAIDAVVIANVTDGMIKKITEYSKYHEIKYAQGMAYDSIDKVTGEIIDKFPYPYPSFRKELEIRTCSDPQKMLEQVTLPYYEKGEEIKPIFVSRMANRKVTGSAHMDTIRSAKEIEEGYKISKVSLTSLKLDGCKSGILDYYNKTSDKLLYNALLARLLLFDGDAKKAFAEPFYKPLSDHTKGEQKPALVKKVKLMEKTTSSVSVEQGTAIADNGSMVRTDIFYVEKEGYYIVPIYVADVIEKNIPNKAIVAAKPMNEWKEMKDEDFVFSLYPKDLIKVTFKKEKEFSLVNEASLLPPKMLTKEIFVYYVSASISGASFHVINHDNTYKINSLGAKTIPLIEKYQVDVLGNYTKVGKEKRQYFNLR